MAGWPITGINWQNVDWACPTHLSHFVAAINERLDACRQIAGNTPEAYKIYDYFDSGDDVHFLIRLLQNTISALASATYPGYGNTVIPGNFVKRFTGSTLRVPAEFSNQDFGTYWKDTEYYPSIISTLAGSIYPETVSLADICKYISGRSTATSFRRATTMPSNWASWSDSAYSFGPIQTGDIVGPWLLRDMQEVLNHLIWVQTDAFYWASYGQGVSNFYRGAGSSPTSYSAAYTLANADYKVVGLTDLPQVSVVYAKPQNYYVCFEINTGGVRERAARASSRKRTAYFFVRSEKNGDYYFTNNNTMFIEDKFALVTSFTHSGAGQVIIPAMVSSTIIGQVNSTHSCGMKPTEHYITNSQNNESMRCAALIENFAISGGFTYY